MSRSWSFAHSRLRGAPHGAHDVLVAGASAQVALEALADLLVAGVRILPEQVRCRDDHPRRAVPALQRVLLVEGTLERMQATVRQALDRGDLGTVRLYGQD